MFLIGYKREGFLPVNILITGIAGDDSFVFAGINNRAQHEILMQTRTG